MKVGLPSCRARCEKYRTINLLETTGNVTIRSTDQKYSKYQQRGTNTNNTNVPFAQRCSYSFKTATLARLQNIAKNPQHRQIRNVNNEIFQVSTANPKHQAQNTKRTMTQLAQRCLLPWNKRTSQMHVPETSTKNTNE